MRFTAEHLAGILEEEFVDGGDIDTWLLGYVVDGSRIDEDLNEDDKKDTEDLREVLERVATRINALIDEARGSHG